MDGDQFLKSVAKRALDILLSIAIVVPAFLICAAIGSFVLIAERSNPLLVQTRLGRAEKPFRLLKLRTMRPGTLVLGTHEVRSDAVTPIGKVLRKLKLDEVPQVLNVLAGSMSLVGPRPGLPTQLELRDARRENGVFAVRPGVTGLAQVQDIDMSTPVELAEKDAEYIRTRSLGLDLRIMFMTVAGRGRGDRVRPGDREVRADADRR